MQVSPVVFPVQQDCRAYVLCIDGLPKAPEPYDHARWAKDIALTHVAGPSRSVEQESKNTSELVVLDSLPKPLRKPLQAVSNFLTKLQNHVSTKHPGPVPVLAPMVAMPMGPKLLPAVYWAMHAKSQVIEEGYAAAWKATARSSRVDSKSLRVSSGHSSYQLGIAECYRLQLAG